MSYRLASGLGVRLRFRRRVPVSPQYGPPTVLQHLHQQLMRNYARQMFVLYARVNPFISGAELPQSITIIHPDGQPETVPIRIKP